MKRNSLDRYVTWGVLALPALVYGVGYAGGQFFYGEVVHATGRWSTWLLMLALAVSPLALLFPGRSLPRWLVHQRRAIGVASFALAALHTIVYLQRQASLADIAEDALTLAYLTGWAALLLFAVLAATSNDYSVRRLGRTWKRLHRCVYAAAILVFLHWLWVAFDRGDATVHALVLAVIVGLRFWLQYRLQKSGGRRP